MAQSGDTGSLTYAGIAIILLVAIGALALFRFNLFDVSSMLGEVDEPRRAIPRNPADGGSDGSAVSPEGQPWDSTMPDAAKYQVKHEQPLPEKLTYTHHIGAYSVDIELRLVPQGWFIMGEADGVRSNMPKRWIWLDDYYISTCEFNNDQFYAFILADGYRDAEFWTPEGFKYISQSVGDRGTHFVGWKAIDSLKRLWALASPRDQVTLEVLDADKLLGAPERKVLVLPANGEWSSYLTYDQVGRTVSLKYRDTWAFANARDLAEYPDHDLVKQGLLRTTDRKGRIDLSDLSTDVQCLIIAFADSDTDPPLFGDIRRSRAPYMRGPKMPVVGVSWFEADACCRFFQGTLPTEAQWEKAGRGVDGRLFPWGNKLELTQTAEGQRFTTPYANLNLWQVKETGSFPTGASVYGVLDLVGNVSEWCRDVYLENPNWSERNPFHPGGPQDRRSERGSSTHDDDEQTAKIHNRRSSDPYSRGVDSRGFRIVFDADTALKLTGRK
ncbi:MAG: SUMF1/EgtB/PvdO family nonheme iron enzyme [Planctomycetes bacterium]|nr:SUMF1/EgtB/PvdO family nonheme iron enzyme [Planctomycetota bacterium]MCB9934795.1 SUMF1/EgtB/PvdO family nonheme iron enzyme [Planctomycetota bacterium]